MLLVITSFLLGVGLSVIAVWFLFKRRLLFATMNGVAGFSLLAGSIIVSLIFLNIHTYISLTSERQLAVIKIGKMTVEGLPVTVQTDEWQRVFLINAQEWQLDARFLKWKSWAYLFGSEPVVRLENFSERLPLQAKSTAVKYPLVSEIPVIGKLGSTLSDWLGMIDTYYGSSVYMPAAEGSKYSVTATVSGLIARAENQQARIAVNNWMSQ